MSYCILVVEDNQTNSELLCDWLEVEGYTFVTAADLKGSFAALAKQPLDAVLLDINLGAEDGLTLVGWMRQKPEFREIPVIAVTAHALAWIIRDFTGLKRKDALIRLMNTGFSESPASPFGASEE